MFEILKPLTRNFGLQQESNRRNGSPYVGTMRRTSQLMQKVVDSIQRHHGFELHPEQLACGLAMTERVVAEMATGEGKTASAVLAAVLQTQQGNSLFLATANDYLAQRDAEFAAPVLADFGQTCASIAATMTPSQRQTAYRADVVYGSLREFIFDYLRSRMTQVPRPLAAASGNLQTQHALTELPRSLICDEADSILIDESLTPFILSDRGPVFSISRQHGLKAAVRIAKSLTENCDYVELSGLGIALTPEGRMKIDRHSLPEECRNLTRTELHQCVELAIRALRDFHRDRHYIVQGDEVSIVDEFTGRIGVGRQWSGGVHQAIQAKENIPLTAPTVAAASMTAHDFISLFPQVSGMTGTAVEAEREFRSVFELRVQQIPQHRPLQRTVLPPAIFRTIEEKWRSLIDDVLTIHQQGRPVLIGTRTIESSEQLSLLLREENLEHVLLNALNPESESAIVAEAGQPGRITIATNMAGRGTDIRLHKDVAEKGGLHVIGTELHASRRIDRQLMGRGARQGDPGSFREYLSLEDSILEHAFDPEFIRKHQRRHWNAERILKLLRTAQRNVEQRDMRLRSQMYRRNRKCQQILRSVGLDPIINPFPDDHWTT